MVASYIAYHFWRPAGHVNYGELLEPRPLPGVHLASLGGERFEFSQLKGSWILMNTTADACDARCRERLVYIRQVRLAEGKESERIERVWLIGPNTVVEPALVAEHPGLHIVRDPRNALVASLPRADASDHIYVIDPLGNLMMRFPADADPRRMLKDMSRLLRHSKWK